MRAHLTATGLAGFALGLVLVGRLALEKLTHKNYEFVEAWVSAHDKKKGSTKFV